MDGGFLPRFKLPEGGARRGIPDDDPFLSPILQGASKLYQKRREIEEQLKRDFPAEDLERGGNGRRRRLFPGAPPAPPPIPRDFPRERSRVAASNSPAPSEERPFPPAPPLPPLPRGRARVLRQGAGERSESQPKAPARAPSNVPSEVGDEEAERARKQAEDRDRRHKNSERARQRQAQEEEDNWEREMRERISADRNHARVASRQPGDDPREDDWEARNHAAAEAAANAARHNMAAEYERQRAQRDAEAKQSEMREQAEKLHQRAEQKQQRDRDRRQRAEQKEQEQRKAEARRSQADDNDRGRPRSPVKSPEYSPQYMQRSLQKTVSLPSLRPPKFSQEEQLRRAECAAMKELEAVRLMRKGKDREKGFKDLLRAWHPDKNLDNSEIATAVFQRLQSERARVIGN